MFCFAVLAKKWPKLMQRWESVESILPKHRDPKEKCKLAQHLRILALIVLMSSLGKTKAETHFGILSKKYIFLDLFQFCAVEHVLNAFSIMYFGKVCLDRDNLFEELFRVQLSHLFILFPYSLWIAIVGKMVNVISTFCWNYMDLFIMMISVSLSTRFKQINEDLQRIKGKVGKNAVKLKTSEFQ